VIQYLSIPGRAHRKFILAREQSAGKSHPTDFKILERRVFIMALLETPFPAVLSGNIVSLVTDPTAPATPQTIIEKDAPWRVAVDWNLSGPLAPFMAGEFTVKTYVEDIAGTTFDGQIGPTMVVNLNEAAPTNNRQYHRDFIIPAATVPVGVYRLTTILTYANLGVPMELAGFVEGPLVQIYNAAP
jgi:hypothetical protein